MLPDYHALVPECVAVLEEREDALVTVNVLAEQLRDKQEAAAKMAAALGPAADTDKRMVALNAAMHALQVRLDVVVMRWGAKWPTWQGVAGLRCDDNWHMLCERPVAHPSAHLLVAGPACNCRQQNTPWH